LSSFLAIAFLFFLNVTCNATEWPDSGWLSNKPRSDALLSSVAFVSPVGLEFFQIINAWKRLDKKYHSLGVDFLMVAKNEANLPYSKELINSELQGLAFDLPIYLDDSAQYSKRWRAYVMPTVSLVLKNGKLINFEAGAFDPGLFEKALQKALKENGAVNLPSREFLNEGDSKSCGHAHTIFLSEKFQRAWGSNSVTLEGKWTQRPFWIEKKTNEPFSLESTIQRANVGILAESVSTSPAKIFVTLDGHPLKAELRGRDVQEEKLGKTFLTIKSAKLYEIISHSVSMPHGEMKLKLTTSAKDLILRSLQALPYCQVL
jgi:hypothetical protein